GTFGLSRVKCTLSNCRWITCLTWSWFGSSRHDDRGPASAWAPATAGLTTTPAAETRVRVANIVTTPCLRIGATPSVGEWAGTRRARTHINLVTGTGPVHESAPPSPSEPGRTVESTTTLWVPKIHPSP